MNISVLRDNKVIQEVDLGLEVPSALEDRVAFLVGRSSVCHIVLDDIKVSREYAEIIFEKKSWSINIKNQEKSMNINGLALKEKKLENSDNIIVGPFSLKVSLNQSTTQVSDDAGGTTRTVDLGEKKEEIQEDIEEEAKEEVEEEVKEETKEEEQEGFPEDEVDAGEESAEEEGEEFVAEGEGEFSEGGEEGEDYEYSEDSEYSEEYTEEADGDAGEKTQMVSGLSVHILEIFGEHAPYDSFKLEDAETRIGRDATRCQIILSDPEVSSVHAVIKKIGPLVIIEDMRSGNGTLIEGKRINKSELNDGDEFVIGSTTFTYKATSHFLANEQERLMPVEENQSVEVEEVVEVDGDFDDGGVEEAEISSPGGNQSLFSKDALKDPEKRKKILMAVVGLFVLWIFLSEEESPPPPPKKVAKEEDKKEEKSSPTPETPKMTDSGPKVTAEQEEFLEQQYVLVKEMFAQRKFQETLFELEKIFQIVDDWKGSRQIEASAKEALAAIEEQERKRKEEEERRQIKIKVDQMLVKAKEAVEGRKEKTAEFLFAEILKFDPSNFDVPQLKLELENWKKEEERKKFEEERKKAERQKKVGQLSPGKNEYLRKNWYTAIMKLEEFLKISGMDEDLTKEATAMLESSRDELKKSVTPLVSKARSLKRGQDLKGAYEHYTQVLVYDPSDEESLNEISRISTILRKRSRGVYIEGLISEDLGLFKEAREKFQEVQQISPSDGDYYKRASEKLSNYFD